MITKVGAMTDPPAIGDYAILQAKLDAYAKQVGNQGMILTEWTNTTTTPAIALGSYITHGGTLFVVDTADFAVTAPASDGTYYLKVEASVDTLALSWVASLSGYTWNAIYNGLYDASENQILPYQLVKAGAVYGKRKIMNLMQGAGFVTVDWTGAVVGASLAVSGVISGASLAVTGAVVGASLAVSGVISGASLAVSGVISGAGLGVTGAITAASIDTGYGANKVYKNSFQSISAIANSYGNSTAQLSAMDIGEIRFVYYSCNGWSSIDNQYHAYLKTPAGSNYYITPVSGAFNNRGGSFSGGASFAQFSENDNAITGVFIIRRNS